MSLRRSTVSPVGLDIGSSAIKLAIVARSRHGYTLAACAREPLPPGSVSGGLIADEPLVADAIRRVLEREPVRTREVVVSLSGHAVIVKKITLPAMSGLELAQAIPWEAEQYIPFDIQDVTLDYQILDAAPEDSARTMDVLLVAAKRDTIATYSQVVAHAGAVPVVVDVDAFALQNVYELGYGYRPGEVVALLNVGASAININVLRGAQSVFTRDLSLGGQAYCEALQRDLDVPRRTAEQLACGAAFAEVNREEVRAILRAVSENVLLEIQKTFDFFRAAADEPERLDRIVLSGGASRTDGLAAMLADRFGSPVEFLDPLRSIRVPPTRFDPERLAELAPQAAVAVGLALRRAGDR
jgi:type IV pilus assembly protein PilM